MSKHSYDYDFLVIGAGSGGVRASRIAASHGVKVALIEKKHLGGTCVNVGCVPKKLLAYASEYNHELEDCKAYGWDVDKPVHNWQRLLANKDKEIKRLREIYKNLLKDVDLYTGAGQFKDPHHVCVNNKTISAEKILIATGGTPFIPDIKGSEHFVSSDDMFYLKNCPENLVIYGGGYIATEFASIMAGLGSKVDLIYRDSLFMRHFDKDIRLHLAQELQKRGISLHFDCEITEISKTDSNRFKVLTSHDHELDADCVLAATGRRSQIDELGLNNCDLALEKNGLIDVNSEYQTAQSHIYAVGDIIGSIQLTPLAIAEAHYLADRLFGSHNLKKAPCPNYDYIPTAVFTNPQIGTVGKTQDEAEEEFGCEDVICFRERFRAMKHSLPGRDEKSLLKLVVQKSTDKVLGAHMCGHDAGEIVQGFALALEMGAKKADFDKMIGIHPTSGEEFFTMRTPVLSKNTEPDVPKKVNPPACDEIENP